MPLTIDELKERTEIVALIREDLGEPTVAGQWAAWNPCPFCGHKDCFKASGTRGYYRCFSCGQHGDVLDWLQARGASNLPEAIERLHTKLLIPYDVVMSDEARAQAEAKRTSEAALTDAALWYHAHLTPRARAYLHARGIDDDLIDRFHLGYCAGRGLAFLNHWTEALDGHAGVLQEAGITKTGKGERRYETFSGRITFPNWSAGRVVHMQGRLFPEPRDTKRPKYLSLAGPVPCLWNRAALSAERPIITEGIPDALRLIGQGYPAAAIYGTQAFKAEWASQCEGKARVYYVPDTDPAGVAGAMRTAGAIGRNARVVRLPDDAGDVSDWFAEGGTKEAFDELLRQSQSLPLYTVHDIATRNGQMSKEDRAEALEPVLGAAADMSAMECEAVVDAIVAELDFRRPTVERQITEIRKASDDDDDSESGGQLRVSEGRLWSDERPVSNFTIDLVACVLGSTECVRHVRLRHTSGRVTPVAELRAEDMATPRAFKTWALRQGPYMWTGDPGALSRLWNQLEGRGDAQLIYQPDHIGWLDETFLLNAGAQDRRYFLAGDVLIDDTGERTKPNRDGIIELSEGSGIMPWSLGGEGGTNMPTLLDGGRFPREEIHDLLRTMLGDGWNHALALGWITSCIVSEPLFRRHGFLPFLFIGGAAGSGKDTLVGMLMPFFGVLTPKQETFGASSLAGLQRVFAYYSSLPVWINEGRNEGRPGQIEAKLEFLRGAFMRQTAGSKANMSNLAQTKQYPVRARLIHSGEDAPQDHALLTRYVVLMLSRAHRNYEAFQALRSRVGCFRSYTRDLLEHFPERSARIAAKTEDMLEVLKDNLPDERMAACYAMVAGCYMADWAEDKETERQFLLWLIPYAQEHRHEVEEEAQVNVFLDDLHRLIMTGELERRLYYWQSDSLPDGKRISAAGAPTLHLWFEGIYPVWSEAYRRQRGQNPFARSTLKKHLTGLDCVTGPEKMKFPDENGSLTRSVRAYTIDLPTAPEPLRSLWDGTENEGAET